MTKAMKSLATKIYTIRFTEREYALLNERAAHAGMTLAVYIRHLLFGEHVEKRKRTVKAVIIDHQKFSRVLLMLGEQRYASNLNQIAKAIHQGMVMLPAEQEQSLREACAAIAQMRDLLVDALTKS